MTAGYRANPESIELKAYSVWERILFQEKKKKHNYECKLNAEPRRLTQGGPSTLSFLSPLVSLPLVMFISLLLLIAFYFGFVFKMSIVRSSLPFLAC